MHGYARWNSVAGLASDTACRAAGQIGESGPTRSTDVRKGSTYGHQGLAQMRPVVVRPVGSTPGQCGASWSCTGVRGKADDREHEYQPSRCPHSSSLTSRPAGGRAVTDENRPDPIDPVAPARRSKAADAKAATKTTTDDRPAASFTALLDHLGTLTRNHLSGTPAQQGFHASHGT
jgi:hypothetical protein